MGRERVPGSNNRDRDGRTWAVSRERTSREKENTLRPAAEDGGFHVVVNTSHPQGDNSSFRKDGHKAQRGRGSGSRNRADVRANSSSHHSCEGNGQGLWGVYHKKETFR